MFSHNGEGYFYVLPQEGRVTFMFSHNGEGYFYTSSPITQPWKKTISANKGEGFYNFHMF